MTSHVVGLVTVAVILAALVIFCAWKVLGPRRPKMPRMSDLDFTVIHGGSVNLPVAHFWPIGDGHDHLLDPDCECHPTMHSWGCKRGHPHRDFVHHRGARA